MRYRSGRADWTIEGMVPWATDRKSIDHDMCALFNGPAEALSCVTVEVVARPWPWH